MDLSSVLYDYASAVVAATQQKNACISGTCESGQRLGEIFAAHVCMQGMTATALSCLVSTASKPNSSSSNCQIAHDKARL